MNQNDVRLITTEYFFHPLQYTSRNICKILTRLHDIKIKIRLQFEQLQHLIQHLTMLTCDADFRFEANICAQF
ncbi:hypothetical protein D9M72_638000 [compost metagenome]